MNRHIRIALATASFIALAGAAHASTIPAFSIQNAGGAAVPCRAQFNPNGCSLGFQFSITAGLDVTALGVFDFAGNNALGNPIQIPNGLIEAHAVGIFTDAGALLVSATVPAGLSALVVNQFDYVTLGSAFHLDAGTYRMAAYYIGGTQDAVDGNAIVTGTFTPAAGTGFTVLSAADSLANVTLTGLQAPLHNPGNTIPSIFGPNFLFEQTSINQNAVTPVPEPATLSLLGLGLLGLARKLVRTKRAA